MAIPGTDPRFNTDSANPGLLKDVALRGLNSADATKEKMADMTAATNLLGKAAGQATGRAAGALGIAQGLAGAVGVLDKLGK